LAKSGKFNICSSVCLVFGQSYIPVDTVFIKQTSVYFLILYTLGASNSIFVGAGVGEPGTAFMSSAARIGPDRLSSTSLACAAALLRLECDHDIQDCQWLPPPIHSFRTALLHPTAKHCYTGCIYGTVDAPTPCLRPSPTLIHFTARGRRSTGWRMG
jgi:hypothetical protein